MLIKVIKKQTIFLLKQKEASLTFITNVSANEVISAQPE